LRVSGGDLAAIAALVAAGAFLLIAVLLAGVLLRLRHTVDAATRAVKDLNDRTTPILDKADLAMGNVNATLGQVQTTLDGVNVQLERVDAITGNAQTVTAHVANLATVVTSAMASPLVKAAALGYGVRRAARKRTQHNDEREARALVRESRRGRRRRER
jgi:uncharacterized protein YoxC